MMNLKVSYFDNLVTFQENKIITIEIENKKYFYRFINDLYNLDKKYTDNILFYNDNEEKNFNNKTKIFINFLDLEFNSKKTITDISKYISNTISQEDRELLQKEYTKLIKKFKNMINDIDLPLALDEEVNIETLIKILKLTVKEQEELLDNLFLLIDIENAFKTNNLIIFVNLKQYLTKNELLELYKYSIYKQVQIMLVDSQCYGITLEHEKKLIIDENLDEFML